MKPGDVLANRFEVGLPAGAGGMGQVFVGVDRLTGARVAIKAMRGHDARDTARFAREARTLAELSHPAIVRHVAHGVSDAAELYLAMEWLDGEGLDARLAREGLSIDESVRVARRASEALAAAHSRGIVHRDVKPGNLFLVGGDIDAVKVLDFGIARRLDTSGTLTESGGVLGTVGYMAPEQARGDSGLDARADVYALGCVLFECITGRRAFEGTQVVAVLAKILLEDPPPLRDVRNEVSDALEALVARMLTKDPNARPANGAELARDLAALAPSGLSTARVVAGGRPASLTRGEQRLLAVILSYHALCDDEHVDGTAPTMTPATMPHASALAKLQAAVAVHGARVDRLADGSVLATIAGTSSATDLTLRAARCALELRVELPETPIAMAIGRGDDSGRLAAGNVVERASELARGATPGGPVRMDDVTAGLLDSRFDVDLSEPQGRGLDLLGERESIDSTRTLLGKPTPFVGRERDVEMLEGLWNECVAESSAHAIVVTAPAGVGKSRMKLEILERLRTRGSSAVVWLSRGDPMYAGSSLRFVRQMLRAALAVSHGDLLELQRRQIEVGVARSVAPSERRRVSEFVGQILGVHFPDAESVQLRAARQDPMLMADQMRRAWEDFVEAELRERPVLMVMEDLHWGDAASVAYVDSVLRICRETSLMVLALARPEVNTLFPGMWSTRSVQRIALGGLSRKASERLVREVLGDLAVDAMVTRLVSQADGNAFYLEELIRAVADGKGDALPGTVAAMVQARIEALAPDARRVLRAASVFGEVFWDGGVLALLGGERETGVVRETVTDLVNKEIIARVARGRFAEQSEYAFRHGVVRQVSYEMLTDADRVLGHRLAAQWLERVGETDPASVAEHFQKAGDAGSAIPWWLRAAQAAFDANDLDAAIARAERAIACGADGATRGELRLVQAEASRWCGKSDAAVAYADEASELIAEGTDAWSRAVAEAAVCAARVGRFDVLIRRGQSFERVLQRDDVRPAVLAASSRVVGNLMMAGKRDPGLSLWRAVEAKVSVQPLRDPAHLAWFAFASARIAAAGGDMGAFHDASREATTQFERAGDARMACNFRVNATFAMMELGEYAEAAEQLASAIGEAGRMGLRAIRAGTLHNLGWTLGRLGRLDEAIATEEEAVREAESVHDFRIEGASCVYLALLVARAGDLDRAERVAHRAVELTEPFALMQPFAKAALASVLRDRQQAADALTWACAAMDAMERNGAEEGEAFTRLVHAELLYATHDRVGACAAIATARERLLGRAAKISGARARESFLTRVSEHARTLELASTWLGDHAAVTER